MSDDALSRCFLVAEEVLQAAEDERWDDLSDLESKWASAIRYCFSESKQTEQQIRQLLGVNMEIMNLMKSRQNYIANELTEFSKGRKAVKAYGR